MHRLCSLEPLRRCHTYPCVLSLRGGSVSNFYVSMFVCSGRSSYSEPQVRFRWAGRALPPSRLQFRSGAKFQLPPTDPVSDRTCLAALGFMPGPLHPTPPRPVPPPPHPVPSRPRPLPVFRPRPRPRLCPAPAPRSDLVVLVPSSCAGLRVSCGGAALTSADRSLQLFTSWYRHVTPHDIASIASRRSRHERHSPLCVTVRVC